MIVKMTILRFLGSNDDKEKEKIGKVRPEGLPLREFRWFKKGHRCIGHTMFQRRCQAPRKTFFSTG